MMHSSDLRRRAESKVSHAPIQVAHLSSDRIQQLVYELQVHQEELKIQNEELRRAETKLEEARDHYRNLYNYAPVGYLSVGQRTDIIKANPLVCELLGRSQCQLIGTPFARFLSIEDATTFQRLCRHVFAAQTRETCELSIYGPNGEVVEVRCDINGDGTIESSEQLLNVALLDITEKKAAQRSLQLAHDDLEVNVAQRTAELAEVNRSLTAEIERRKEIEMALETSATELERSNRELRNFAFSISHDLSAPLRGIMGFAKLLHEETEGSLDESARELLHLVLSSAKRLREMLDGLLDYARVHTCEDRFQPIDCEEIVAEAIDNLACAIEETGATITHDPLPVIIGDKLQMVRVFQNLIHNALVYRGDEPPKVHIRFESRDREWVCSVCDNGVGMAPQQMERIFLVFVRLFPHDERHGIGMGLSICKGIVERHGGNIWAESEPGRGSAFYFSIPAEQ